MADQRLIDLGLAEPARALTEVVRVRVDADLLRSLDKIETYARANGHQQVSRSSLIRAAISGFVEGVSESVPEVEMVTLAG